MEVKPHMDQSIFGRKKYSMVGMDTPFSNAFRFQQTSEAVVRSKAFISITNEKKS